MDMVDYNQNGSEYKEEVLLIRWVSKKTTGGNAVSFSVMVAVGDMKGKVGVGLGRAKEVPIAIRKAVAKAKKNFINVPMKGTTIPHEVFIEYKSAKLILKPAPIGTGLKTGSVVRVLLDLAGVKDVSGKIIGSRNRILNTYATIRALKSLSSKKREQI